MAVTLTLKNIPEAVYEQLKLSAGIHHRSLNSEAIVCLEAQLLPVRLTAGERLARARKLRAKLGTAYFDPKEIDAMKREGRP